MQKASSEMANPLLVQYSRCVLIVRNYILLTDFMILEGNTILKLNKFGQQSISNSGDKDVSYFSSFSYGSADLSLSERIPHLEKNDKLFMTRINYATKRPILFSRGC